MLAHISGLPVEEWLLPLVAAGGGLIAAVRARFDRRHGRA
jgi:hypothetical protein